MSEVAILDVSEADFEQAVLLRSHTVPVLVDFWAAWCGPCHALAPALEQAVGEMNGAVELAKVNVDENPALAARCNVRGLPTVQLFDNGEAAAGFVGAQSLAQIRQFLHQHCPTAADRRSTEGDRLLETGDREGARRAYEEALELDPHSGGGHLGLARLALGAQDLATLERHASAVPPTDDGYDAAQGLLRAAELVRSAVAIGDREQCERRLETDPTDMAAHFALAGHCLGQGDLRQALELYLEIAAADRSWRDEAARKAMLVVFNLLGARHPMSDEFRDRLSSIYY